jgi:hypothetical protein
VSWQAIDMNGWCVQRIIQEVQRISGCTLSNDEARRSVHRSAYRMPHAAHHTSSSTHPAATKPQRTGPALEPKQNKTMKKHVTGFLGKAGFEPMTLGYQAERYDHCTQAQSSC